MEIQDWLYFILWEYFCCVFVSTGWVQLDYCILQNELHFSENAFPCFQHFIAVFPVIKRIRSQALHFGSTVVVLLLAAVGMGHLEWITGNANINLYSST